MNVDLPSFPVQEINYPVLVQIETSEITGVHPTSSSSRMELFLGKASNGILVFSKSVKAPTTIQAMEAQRFGWIHNKDIKMDYPWNDATISSSVNVYFYAMAFNQFNVTVRLYGIA